MCALLLYKDARAFRRAEHDCCGGFFSPTWLDPIFAAQFLWCLDAFESDLQFAQDNSIKFKNGHQKAIVSWKEYERNRMARHKKLPAFLCIITVLMVILFVVQDIFAGWESSDTVLVTSRITEHNEWYRIVTSNVMYTDVFFLLLDLGFMWV